MGRMSSPLVLIQTWTYKLQIEEKDVYEGEICTTHPFYTQGKLFILHHLKWPWPSDLVHVHDTKSHDEQLNSCYLKIPPCTKKLCMDKFGCKYAHRVNSDFDNYVELSQKIPLTPKQNTMNFKA
jgi:hypothetical protein